jgi:hypothetical protein
MSYYMCHTILYMYYTHPTVVYYNINITTYHILTITISGSGGSLLYSTEERRETPGLNITRLNKIGDEIVMKYVYIYNNISILLIYIYIKTILCTIKLYTYMV